MSPSLISLIESGISGRMDSIPDQGETKRRGNWREGVDTFGFLDVTHSSLKLIGRPEITIKEISGIRI